MIIVSFLSRAMILVAVKRYSIVGSSIVYDSRLSESGKAKRRWGRTGKSLSTHYCYYISISSYRQVRKSRGHIRTPVDLEQVKRVGYGSGGGIQDLGIRYRDCSNCEEKIVVCTKRLDFRAAEYCEESFSTGSDNVTSCAWVLNQILVLRQSLQSYPLYCRC